MKLSSLQLKQYFFTRMEINARSNDSAIPLGELNTNPFDFLGVRIGTDLEVGDLPEQQDDPRDFVIKLGIKIENKKGKIAPYDVYIEALGSFVVSPEIPVERRRDFVIFNGCSILYSAMREMVLIMTSRFAQGGLVLPTVNFVEHIRKNMITNEVETPSSAQQNRKHVRENLDKS